ncbi:hypothetical protein [Asticcacaulis sp. 201]|uniref:hypothetical protein n=1 Tax=Asticcacaulis sp. 201 TaxID=3028787 RepID=UPI002915FBF2|nr:hypothetical protein [Asticcacaulis sp. 201]MDV6331783.1 hypothetical protein [Asticcacaulis sp. 201]
MTIRLLLAAIWLGLAPLSAALPNPAVAAPTAEARSIATIEEIYSNLGVVDVMKLSMQQALINAPSMSNFTSAQKAKLVEITGTVIDEQRPALLHKLAIANRGDLTPPQLQVILKISKIRYIQDAIAHGADPSRVADPKTMTAEESAFLDSVEKEQYILDFLQRSANFDTVKPDMEAISTTIIERFVTWLSTQKS